MNIEDFSAELDVADVAAYELNERVGTRLGPGVVIEYVERSGIVKYRVDVERRGDSFVFFENELRG